MSPTQNSNVAAIIQSIETLRGTIAEQQRAMPESVRKEVELQLKPLTESQLRIIDRVGFLEKQANDRLMWEFEEHKQIVAMITSGFQDMEQRQGVKFDELRDLINQNQGNSQQTQITGQQHQLSTWQQVSITVGSVLFASLLSFLSALYFAHALHP